MRTHWREHLEFPFSSAVIVLKCESSIIFAVLALSLSILPPSARPNQASRLDGFWITDGYGYLFKIEGPLLVAYETTSISCIKTFSARRNSAVAGDAEATFSGKEVGILRVLPGPSPDVKLFHEDGAASNIVAHRIAEPPATFRTEMPNTPQANFDVFWHTFNEQYPFFAMKGIDWSAVREKYRPGVTPSTTPLQMFEILRAMIQPLHDAHTGIFAKEIKKYFSGWRIDTQQLSDPDVKRTIEIIKTKYLRTPLRDFCNKHLSFGMLEGSIGYLRIDAFDGYTRQDDYGAMARSLESALDAMFNDGANLKGLVIDVRLNDGGTDPLGLAISARLTERDYLAYTKEARIDPGDPGKWSPGQDSIVRPTTRPHFYGRVVLLTGSRTVSAGETFAMSLMERTPRVLRVGENTQGVFSDVLERRLPNGWRFGLPNERYLTKDGRSFDGPGVPPDIGVAVFPKSDLQGNRDGAIEKALQLLSKH